MAQNAPGAGPPQPTPTSQQPNPSRRMLILLAVMLAAMWFWKSTIEGQAAPAIPYSQLYSWLQQGKVESVTLKGDVAEATLKQQETIGERTTKTIRTNLPSNDSALLPLLRDKGVRITVTSQQQP